jgi:STE24 endopeptidase
MRVALFLLALSVAGMIGLGSAAQRNFGDVPRQVTSEEGNPTSAQSQAAPPPPSAQYTLSPEQRAKAVAYSRIRYTLYFLGVLVSLGIYLLLWRSGATVLFRDWARRLSTRHVVQCLVFVLLFVAAVSLLRFPLSYYSGFVVERRFGLSTQGFGSWLGDWGKSLLVILVLGVIGVWIFYTVVRWSPRRWWFYFWVVSIPLVLALMLVEPYVIEPLFFGFTPLARTQPALTERIEEMLHRAGLEIPPSRVFEMNAGSKTTTVDAYVSGLGASQRVVIWDTTLEKMTPDEVLLVLGHETGHYVLHHVLKEIALNEVILLVLSYLGFVAIKRVVERTGSRTEIEGVGDLASLPIVLLVVSVLVFLATPLASGISRYYEHQADQFALEVTHGVVADPNAVGVRAFQILGEENLADPDPSPFITFWLYTHPPIDQRIRFAASYRPWAEGKPLELVHPVNP